MPTERLYAVDRLEGRQAVLVDDDGHSVTLLTSSLPPGAHEGVVLRVPLDPAGKPAWDQAQVDQAETARRRAEAAKRLERLKKRDPGGDLKL